MPGVKGSAATAGKSRLFGTIRKVFAGFPNAESCPTLPVETLLASNILPAGSISRLHVRRWKDAFLKQGGTLCDAMRGVDFQNGDRGTPDGGAANEHRTNPTKMSLPFLATRIVEPYSFSRPGIDAGEIGSFVVVISEAGQRKIAGHSFAAVLLGNNVVDLEADRRELLGKPVILATVVRTLLQEPKECFVHFLGSLAAFQGAARLRVENVEQATQPLVGFSLASLIGAELPGAGFGG